MALVIYLLQLSGILNVEGVNVSVTVTIPITVTVAATITPTETENKHSYVSHLTGLDRVLSKMADFDDVFNGTIDRAWELNNTVKSAEFQEFFDFIWGDSMGNRAADIVAREMENVFV